MNGRIMRHTTKETSVDMAKSVSKTEVQKDKKVIVNVNNEFYYNAKRWGRG